MKQHFFRISYGYSFIMTDGDLARLIETTQTVKSFSSRGQARDFVKAFCKNRPHEEEDFQIEKVTI